MTAHRSESIIAALVVIAMTSATACGGIVDAELDAAIEADSALDAPATDAAPVIDEALLGEWVFRDNQGQVISRFLYRDDFTFELQQGANLTDGTYALPEPPRHIRLSFGDADGNRYTSSFTYYVSQQDNFYSRVFVAEGATNGLVGTWVNIYRTSTTLAGGDDTTQEGTTTRITLRGNGTGLLHYQYADGDSDRMYKGMWAWNDAADKYVFSWGEDTLAFSFTDDIAITISVPFGRP